MEQIQNHKSVDSQSIWLKSVRSELDWLDLTNPWLKEEIKSDPELIYSYFMGNCTLCLSSTRVHSPGCSVGRCVGVWVDVSPQSSPRLTSRLSSASVLHWWTIHQRISLDSMRNCAPPGLDGLQNIYILLEAPSSKLVRAGLKGLPL